MKISPTFSRYIGLTYIYSFLGLLLIMMGIVYMFDTIELLRRAEGKELGLMFVFQMGLLKLPQVSLQLIPFAILFSSIFTFWKLTKNNELVVARAAGFSVWHFLTPVLGTALVIGVLKIVALNPLSAVLLSRYEHLNHLYLKADSTLIDMQESGLWLRQKEANNNEIIFFAREFNPKKWALKDITLFILHDKKLLERYDAVTGNIGDNAWVFRQTMKHDFKNPPQIIDQFVLETSVTTDDINESFASADTISFWNMPTFINSLESLGFPTTKFRIFYNALLADPILFMAMVFLAAGVSLRPPRHGKIFLMVSSGVVIGFLVFIADNFLQAWGLSETIPPFVAGWAAPLITLVFGVSVMLYREES